MSDDEARREDARIEAAIDRNLRNGSWGLCWYCKDPTPLKDVDERWFCKYCQRMAANPGD